MRKSSFCISLLISFLISFSSVIALKQRHNTKEPNTKQTASNEEESKKPQEKGFWRIFFGDPIAFFTGILAIFTIILAGATVVLIIVTQRGIRSQAIDMRESLDVGSRSADAAKVSADAARAIVESDRAWIGTPELTVFDNKKGTISIRYKIENVGKQPIYGIFMNAKPFNVTPQEKDAVIYMRKDILIAARKKVESDLTSYNNIMIVPHATIMVISNTYVETSFPSDVDIHTGIIGCIIYGPKRDDRRNEILFTADFGIENGKGYVNPATTFRADEEGEK